MVGHSYLVESTECYAKIVKRYFETGKLPEEQETYCDGPDPEYFPGSDAIEGTKAHMEFVKGLRG
jgi:hypothetical protein